MVSAYAQSGKLFEKPRSSRVLNVPPRRENRFGANSKNIVRQVPNIAGQKTPQVSRSPETKEDPEIDWLNRVPQSAQPSHRFASTPGTIEMQTEEIQMSQMTDDSSSQHSDSQGYKIPSTALTSTPNQQALFASSHRQPLSVTRLHQVATPMRAAPVASRFHHLAMPSPRTAAVASTPRANISVASSRTPYQPRSKNKSQGRSWMERFTPSTPFRGIPSSSQKESATPIISSNKSASNGVHPFRSVERESSSNGAHPFRSVGKETGRFSFSRPRTEHSSDQTSCGSSATSHESIAYRQLATFQVTSEKLIQDQLKKLEEKATSIQEMLATAHASNMTEIASSKMTVVNEIDTIKTTVANEISDTIKTTVVNELDTIKTTAANELDTIKTTIANELDGAGKDQIRQLEERASDLRDKNEQEAKGFFESQRLQLIDKCLPFLQQKATFMITGLLQTPSIVKTVEKMFKARMFLIKTEPEPAIVSGPIKTASDKSVVTKKKQDKSPKTVPLRRSKRKAAQQNPGCPEEAPVVSVAANKKKRDEAATKTSLGRIKRSNAPDQKPKLPEPTASLTDRVVSLAVSVVSAAKPSLVPTKRSKSSKKKSTTTEPTGLSDAVIPVPTEWSTPKKRKRVFGRVVSEHGVAVSPELSFLPSRKEPRTKARTVPVVRMHTVPVKVKSSVPVAIAMTPRVPIGRSKPGFRCKNKTVMRGPAVIEDIFDFNF